jgi:transcriptional regulator with XRE-family HTH domain
MHKITATSIYFLPHIYSRLELNYSEQEVKKMTPIGYKIKNYLKANRNKKVGPRNQGEFAKNIGFSYSHVSAIMTGKATPSMGMLAAIAKEMNMSLSELLKEV